MNETFIIVFLIFLSFVLGFVPVLLLGRGLFVKYIKAFLSGRIIVVVHLNRGGTTFRLSSPYSGSPVLKYTLWGKKDVHSLSIIEGSVVKGGFVSWIHTKEGSSAPFIFDSLISFTKMEKVKVKNEKGVEEEQEKEVVKYFKFEGFNDSGIIYHLFNWALMRPKTMMGNIPIGMIIIGLVVVVAVILIITQLGGGAENVI